MKVNEHEQFLIRKYLIGELNEEQQQQFEQRVITDPDYKEEVLITEEELLEDFVSGTLSGQERELFLKRYSVSPAQLQKVKIAKALNKYATVHPAVLASGTSAASWAKSLINFFRKRDRFSQFSFAAVVLLFVAGGGLLAYLSITHDKRANYAALMKFNGPESEVLQPNDLAVVSVTLSTLLLRGAGEPKTLAISKQTQTVQFRLADPSNGTHVYQVILKDSSAAEVFKLEDLPPRRLGQLSVLVLQIPAKMLRPQEYQLEISEKKPDGTYENPSSYSFKLREMP